ncbi:hypothetical protein J2Z48_000336 [Croceifilum oryzae]|uniref:Uncharacterized protein n=1 Tax=Croceifilum oryzae TaxID=1553429 RepID=A0AAJ1TCC1_9BACL|nr:hypothetical protein [Croceifilum oryzae]
MKKVNYLLSMVVVAVVMGTPVLYTLPFQH